MAETWQFLQGGEDLIQRFDYDGSNHVIYQGWARPGTASSDSIWRIRQLNYSGDNITTILYPSGSPAFAFVWDSRTGYGYS